MTIEDAEQQMHASHVRVRAGRSAVGDGCRAVEQPRNKGGHPAQRSEKRAVVAEVPSQREWGDGRIRTRAERAGHAYSRRRLRK